jgi:hypothetical protein
MTDIITYADIVHAQEGGILDIVIGEVLVVDESGIQQGRRSISQEISRIQHILDRTEIGGHVVVHVVTQVGTKHSAKAPFLIGKVRTETEDVFREGGLIMDQVIVVDDPVPVLIDVQTFDGFAIGAIDLFEHIEGIRAITDRMYLYIIPSTTCDRSYRVIDQSGEGILCYGEISDREFVIRYIEIDIPFKVLGLYRYGSDAEIDAFVGHITHIPGHLVPEIGTDGDEDSTEQVLGLLVVVVDATADPVIQKAEVYADVR